MLQRGKLKTHRKRTRDLVFMLRSIPILSLLGATLSACIAHAAPPAAKDIQPSQIAAERQRLESEFAGKLEQLAKWCEERSLSQAAARVRSWLPKRDPLKLYIFKLPESFAPPADLAESDDGREFWQRFVALRTVQAERLFTLAKQAHANRHYGLAYDLVRQACRENPDHAQARTILGYLRYKDRWVLPDTARRLAAGQVEHEQFGWLPADQVKRYERGMRHWRGNWTTKEEDERLHSQIKTGWRIASEHYVVTTNHSLEEGVALSRRLEKLHEVWRHVFVDYYLQESEMARWFDRAMTTAADQKPPAPLPSKQHNVVYFRNRDEYNATLRASQPQIEMTVGIYFAQPHTAYFFAGNEQYDGTLIHEGTHQLFQEARQAARNAGEKNNFWIVEAIACYMESLLEQDDYYTLGGLDEGRAPAALQRLLEDKFYVPLGELTGLGMRGLQRDERLAKIYSQISGQALFLMHADDGRYRKPTVDYLIAVYGGKADAATLSRLTGKSYEQLDREYYDFMRRQSAGEE